MLSPSFYRTFEPAYLAVLAHVSGQFEFHNAPRGNAAHESLGLSFQIANPRERLPYLRARKVNPVFHFAEALWYLAGRRDLDMIGYYAPRMRHSSADGRTISGSAYGARIFKPSDWDSLSPFDRVLELLRTEKDSKRGVLPVFTADELTVEDNPDMSCVVALHLLAREGRLHMVCYMRANDCDRGLLSDVFSFTMIQEFAAIQLGLELGSYIHHIGSAHIGDRDALRVSRVLDEAEDRTERVADRFTFPSMPANTTFATIDAVLQTEQELRTNQIHYGPRELSGLGFDPYWCQVLLLFEVYRQLQHTVAEVDESVLDALDPGFRWLMARRWPTRISEGSIR
ncbi:MULTISPECIES: thymidylate synthase [unclassified Streptomyces]|uniref:thymidylate synthase n=1 Tax=unclassified Streptomyces TaxID=2593676 RepID=UPI00343955D5